MKYTPLDIVAKFDKANPTEFDGILENLVQADPCWLLAPDLTARILNVGADYLPELTAEGKLPQKLGAYEAEAVLTCRRETQAVRRKALQEMAAIENSVSDEIY